MGEIRTQSLQFLFDVLRALRIFCIFSSIFAFIANYSLNVWFSLNEICNDNLCKTATDVQIRGISRQIKCGYATVKVSCRCYQSAKRLPQIQLKFEMQSAENFCNFLYTLPERRHWNHEKHTHKWSGKINNNVTLCLELRLTNRFDCRIFFFYLVKIRIWIESKLLNGDDGEYLTDTKKAQTKYNQARWTMKKRNQFINFKNGSRLSTEKTVSIKSVVYRLRRPRWRLIN